MQTEQTEPVPATCCTWCGDALDRDELENPHVDTSNEVMCDRCWEEEYEGTCDRCMETVAKDELSMKPGHLLALWQDVGRVKRGYYRVLRWPIYADGIITGHIIAESLEYVCQIDAKGEAAAKEAWTPGGSLCERCRSEIDKCNVQLSSDHE